MSNPVSIGFKRTSPDPLDEDAAVADVTAIEAGIRYAGQVAYQSGAGAAGTQGLYYLKNGIADGDWTKLTGGTIAPTAGGTGLTSYALGDVLYASATNVLARRAGNITTTKMFLTQTGNGSVSAAPAWGTIAPADLGTGSPSSSNFLRGDGTWNVPTVANGIIMEGVVNQPTTSQDITLRYASTTVAINLQLQRSRGTPGSPAVVVGSTTYGSGDRLGSLSGMLYDGAGFFTVGQIRFFPDSATIDGTHHAGRIEFLTTLGVTSSINMVLGSSGQLDIVNSGIKANGSIRTIAGGIGYGPAGLGVGGTVTQLTSKTTNFTLNAYCGTITLATGNLNSDAFAGSTWTNSAIAVGDVIVFMHISGGTIGAYTFNAVPAAGSASFRIRNVTGGALNEAGIVVAFFILKAVTT